MNKIQMVDLQSQYKNIKSEIDNAVIDVIESGQYINGPAVQEFSSNLAKYMSVKHVIPCANGTDALQVALMALELQPGDEVITTDFTFAATVEVIALLNLKPILIDVDLETFNIDCDKLEVEIKKVVKEGKLKPKAIIPVDLFGLPARYRMIDKIAKKYDLKVVEDAAQSFGGSIRDKKVGTFGDIAATSFYPAKPLGCYGDGGAIFTNDDSLAEECKAIRIHGTKQDKYNSEMIGLNGRLDSIQAAVLLEKLSIFDEELEMRNEINFYYRKYLNNAQYHPKEYQSAHALFSIVLGSNKKRNDLIERLSKNNIPTVIYYKFPIHLMKAFENLGYLKGDLPVSESLSDKIVSLPMHPYISKEDINSIQLIIKNN